MFEIKTPLIEEIVCQLKAGQWVEVTGTVYVARDQAHKRMAEALKSGQELPFDIKGQIIFYASPAPAKPGRVIGPIGPTTSARMDEFTPVLLEHGLKGAIGKGPRSENVKQAFKKNRAIYLVTFGGAAALLSKHIKSAKIIAYEDLGPESILELNVEHFPAIIAIDCQGNTIFKK